MNIGEVVIIMSFMWVSIVLSVLTLRVVTKRKMDTEYEEQIALSLPVAEPSMTNHDLVMIESNVVSMSNYRARKIAKQVQSASKVHGKETRIIYALKKL